MAARRKLLGFGKIYLKTIIREIKRSFGRFVAIFGIVALGVGFLAGLLATTPDMKASVGTYYEDTNMSDIFIKATMGLTDADIAAVASLEEVQQVMPASVTDALVQVNGGELLVTRIYGVPLDRLRTELSNTEPLNTDNVQPFLNKIELIEGRLPESPNECVIQQSGGYIVPLEPGTALTISPDNRDYDTFADIYSVMEYTVTGIVKSPLYFSNEREPSFIGNGRLAAVMYVPSEAYALEAYTDLNVLLKGSSSVGAFSSGERSAGAFSADYDNLVSEAVKLLEPLGEERSQLRYDEIVSEAEALINEGETEYNTAKADAEKELAAARAKLNDGRQEIIDGETRLSNAEIQLEEGRAELLRQRESFDREITANVKRLTDGEWEITAAKRTLADAKAQLDAASADVEKARKLPIIPKRVQEQLAEYDRGVADYEAGMKTITEKERELRNGRLALEEGRKTAQTEFAAAEAKLETSRLDIDSGWKELETARQKLQQGEADYRTAAADARRELSDAALQIEDGRAKIAEIEKPQWYILDRNTNVSYVNYKINAEKISDVAKVFPVFFLLVAALVALTTMTRMVEEERLQIGTLKALGYQKRVIVLKYLIYCGLTSVLGCIAGMIGGFQLLPVIIYNAFATMYHLPPLLTQFNWTFGLIACGAVLLCTMGATISACYQSLWEKPAYLMLPRVPKAGKRIFLEYIPFIWNSMKFKYKATARNLIRYKKHFFMTVIGIGGCTSLMLAGFGLRDSMTDIARTQFQDILKYDLRIELRERAELRTDAEQNSATEPDTFLTDFLNETPYIGIHSEAAYARVNSGTQTQELSATLYIPEHPEDFGSFIALRDPKTRAPVSLSDRSASAHSSSAILTQKMAAVLDLNIGDTFTLENASGKTAPCTLSGIAENYVGSFIYMTPDAYCSAFLTESPKELPAKPALQFNTLLVSTGIQNREAQDSIISEVLSSDTVSGAEFTSQIQESYNNLLGSINFVVLVLIFAAGGLAVIVLYNLTNININERNRELATLRVLGYHHGEVAGYIFREIFILSIAGTAAGLLLGIPLHQFIIGVAETVDMMFGRHIARMSFVYSAGATLFFSALVNLLMLKKLRGIKMVDSMKSAD